MTSLIRRFIARHTRFCELPEGVDPLDVLDPGLPIEERPQWYVTWTYIIVGSSIICMAIALVAAVMEYL